MVKISTPVFVGLVGALGLGGIGIGYSMGEHPKTSPAATTVPDIPTAPSVEEIKIPSEYLEHMQKKLGRPLSSKEQRQLSEFLVAHFSQSEDSGTNGEMFVWLGLNNIAFRVIKQKNSFEESCLSEVIANGSTWTHGPLTAQNYGHFERQRDRWRSAAIRIKQIGQEPDLNFRPRQAEPGKQNLALR